MARTARARHPRPGMTLIALGTVAALFFVLMAVAGAWTPRLGLDLRGGTTITLTARPLTGNAAIPADKLAEARTIIQNRVDGLGVGEALVTTSGDSHIEISVPNVQQDELVSLVGQTAQLRFRAVDSVAPASGVQGDTLPGFPMAPPAKTGKDVLLPTSEALAWTAPPDVLAAFNAFDCKDEVNDVLDQPLFACDREGLQKYLLGPVLITGDHVTQAGPGQGQNQVGYVVNLQFDAQGGEAFHTATTALYTRAQPKNQFAIVLDGKVISAPSPRGPIAGGGAEISGNFTLDSATSLANVLKYGSLPLAFDISQVETVSATLGGEQLTGGLIAGALGLALVIAYCFFYYQALGFVVVGSLSAAAVLTYTTMVLLGESVGFALNLPGIAGVIVAIGLTADSFVIYFERIRDEIREGRSLRTAIETGWKRARSTIVVSDMVSLLSAIILFNLASGGVKGFAFTLGLTTVLDLVVVFFFTKPLMSLLGRTAFFGEGHRFSGLDPEHMGVSRASLLGRRPRLAAKGATS